ISRNWLRFWELGFGAPAFHPFDLVAAGVLVHRELMICRQTTARIVRRNSLFTVRDTLEVDRGGPTVRYCDRIDPALACRLVAGATGAMPCDALSRAVQADDSYADRVTNLRPYTAAPGLRRRSDPAAREDAYTARPAAIA
ncbi:MAG: hypothetical protein O3A96_17410, partial [Proteobacteria bacterium]|nr:hypothetical protein [Pseudomonadota bacterium]